MGWGEGEKYWMEFEEGTATMTSLKKDYERIGMKLSQLEIYALSVDSPLKNDELGVLMEMNSLERYEGEITARANQMESLD